MQIKNFYFEVNEETVNQVPKAKDLMWIESESGLLYDPLSKQAVEKIKSVTCRDLNIGYIGEIVKINDNPIELFRVSYPLIKEHCICNSNFVNCSELLANIILLEEAFDI